MVKIIILMVFFLFSLILNITTIIRSNRAYAESLNRMNIRYRRSGSRYIRGLTAEQMCAAYAGGAGTAPSHNMEELWEAFGSPALVSDLAVFSKRLESPLFQYALLDMSRVIPEKGGLADENEPEMGGVYAGGMYFVVAKTDTIIRLLAAANSSDDRYGEKAGALPEHSGSANLDGAFGLADWTDSDYASELTLGEADVALSDVWFWFKAGDICLGAPLWAAFAAVRSQRGGLRGLESIMCEAADSSCGNAQTCFCEVSADTEGKNKL